MKLALRSRKIPDAHYDCVVVGSGVAGLVAANRLIRTGLHVLLVEQHYVVGGYCSAFKRKRYVFDAASHFYPLLGNPETLTGQILGELGIDTRWNAMDPVDQFHFPDGTSFVVPAAWEEYIRRVKENFPGDADNLDRFFEEVRMANTLGLLAFFRGKDSPRLDPFRHLSLGEVLDRYFNDRKLKLLLTGDTPHWGTVPERTSFMFDSMLRMSYFLGNYYPQGGSQVFSNDLGESFIQRGGHLMTQTRMFGLESRGRRVSRLFLERGKRKVNFAVNADSVLYCGDLTGLAPMLPNEGTEVERFESQLRKLRPSQSCFLIHIGARGLSREQLHRLHGYHWQGWNPDQAGKGSLKFKLFVPTLYDASIAPEGADVLVIQKVLDQDYASIVDWNAHKASMEGKIFRELERMIPELPRAMEVHLSATAKTSYRFTLNRYGAMLGWEVAPEQLGHHRHAQQGPLENLFFAGQWTRPGGGITPVIISAENAVKLVVQGLGGNNTAP